MFLINFRPDLLKQPITDAVRSEALCEDLVFKGVFVCGL